MPKFHYDNLTPFQRQLRDVYVDYFNNFLTIERFAEHYELSLDFAKALVKEAQKHEESNTY